jgi:hypothetical protein
VRCGFRHPEATFFGRSAAQLENIHQNNQTAGPAVVAREISNETIFGGEVVAIFGHL